MSTTRLAGIVTVIGSATFCVAAFMPISRVFAEPDPARKLEILRRSPGGWRISQLLFSMGATVAAIGMGMLARQLRPRPATALGYLGTLFLLSGSVLWSKHTYLRARDPEGFVAGQVPPWLFRYYSVLTDAGLVAFGIAFRLAALPVWIGAAMIGVPLTFLAAFLAFKDLPPFSYYVLLAIVGGAIARRGIG